MALQVEQGCNEPRQGRVIVTFPTTHLALAFEGRAHADAIPGRLIPVPREISAGCGWAWAAPVSTQQQLEGWLTIAAVDYEQIFVLDR